MLNPLNGKDDPKGEDLEDRGPYSKIARRNGTEANDLGDQLDGVNRGDQNDESLQSAKRLVRTGNNTQQ